MSTKTPEMYFNNFIVPSPCLRFVVTVYPAHEIVGVAEFVLSDMGLAFVGQEDQILFEDGGSGTSSPGAVSVSNRDTSQPSVIKPHQKNFC